MRKLREHLHWYLLVALFAAAVLIWYALVHEDRAGVFTVAFLDVGQGDAIFIESPTGNQALLDGGPNKSVLRALGKAMPFYDHTIDLLIVTNPDKDHFAGFIDVLRAYKVAVVVEPGTIGASAEFKVFKDEVAKEKAARVFARRGQQINLGGGVILEILFPDRDVEGLETNTGSIVAKLVYGSTSFLLMGDAPEAIENYLVGLDGKRLDSDVLKAGHHGSRTSTSDALLGLASPAFAVISAGKENRYGHPHAEVLERLKRFEVKTLGTYEQGTIVMESDGETVRLKK
ncbi:MAG: hypothetical protein Greene041679_452 [Parcubacteria group bacterium Greene0416_79]|nr:MAG: hypothetical protein Greene041679_452 [Parcubacteria group bacterium Greene0416_79]